MIKEPIKFIPILKEKIWGGSKLIDVLHKKSNDLQSENIGESWEISTVKDNISVVSEGIYKGKNLLELINEFPKELLGEKIAKQFPDEFPLLIKYIDANDDLSIQLHPDDTIAKKRHNSFGKTEMWYIMQVDENAEIIVGFNKKVDTKTYKKHLNKGKITDILNTEKVKKGDVYFIPTGRVHAIKAGVLLAEIQQTSDITYRIFDWNRTDNQGNSRELHTDYAIDAMDFDIPKTYKTEYQTIINESNPVVDCPYFTTNLLPLDGKKELNFSNRDSFTIFMCVSGNTVIHTPNKKTSLNYGETVLIPHHLKKINISSINGSAKLLEVYIK